MKPRGCENGQFTQDRTQILRTASTAPFGDQLSSERWIAIASHSELEHWGGWLFVFYPYKLN